MRRVELLIEEIRDLSGNQRYDSNSGASQARMVRYLKNAQDKIVREAANSKSKYLLKEFILNTVNAQERYPYPEDQYMKNIDTLEYSQNNRDYTEIDAVYTKDRQSNYNGYPNGYIIREDGYLLTPPSNSGAFLRLNYIRQPNKPQKRGGQISAITVSSGQITAMTLNVAEASFDGAEINKEYYLCIVNRDGQIKVKNVQYDSVNTSTGVITLTSNFTLNVDPLNPDEDDQTPAVGDYICVGKRCTNLIELPDTCESFLILHANYEAKYGDSSKWSTAVQDDVKMHLAQIMTSFGMGSDDVRDVPMTNYDYLEL